MSLSPFVYWAQSETHIFLKIDLANVQIPAVDLEKRKIKFEAKGVGAKGLHSYEFAIDFYLDINPEESSFKVLERKVNFTIIKSEKNWWPRLTCQPQKPVWLKVDFDRWQSEDLNDEEEESRDIREDYPDIHEKLQKEEIGYKKEDIKKVYLICYNFFMYIGYFYVCCVLGIRFLRDGLNSFSGTYAAVGPMMCFLQLLQFLEVMHPLFGYTKGSALTSFLQVFGRAVVLFGLIDSEPRMQIKPVVFYLFLVWAAVEVVRYPYYITQLYKRENVLLTWLRYTVWIPLYPLGFLCEGIIILRSIPYTEETGVYSITLPNSYNFTFHFPTALRIYLLFFMLPGMYTLMSYMYKSRKIKLDPKSKYQPKKYLGTNRAKQN